MPLSEKALDRMFQRLAATYGAAWSRAFGDVPISDVKTAWAHELDAFGDHLDMLSWALENLPERAPNAIEFRNLARRAPAPEVRRLPLPDADPERMREALSGIGQPTERPDNLEWARKIIAAVKGGEPRCKFGRDYATEVLTKAGEL